jgi:hypothetical protein
VAHSQSAGAIGWGGARNRADRISHELTLRQARGIVAAAHRAMAIGVPLNRHITLHLGLAGVQDNCAAKVIGAFLTLARDWMRKRGETIAWTWVRENGQIKGTHVHILVHVPSLTARAFVARQRGWLKRATGSLYYRGQIHTSRIGGRLDTSQTSPAVYVNNLAFVVNYMLKGVNEVAGRMLNIERLEPGGSIVGKRCGWSQNLRPPTVKGSANAESCISPLASRHGADGLLPVQYEPHRKSHKRLTPLGVKRLND